MNYKLKYQLEIFFHYFLDTLSKYFQIRLDLFIKFSQDKTMP